MTTLGETIKSLTLSVTSHKQSLDDALYTIQQWVEQNGDKMTETDRQQFSEVLNAERDAAHRDGKPYGDDGSLVISVLRLHAMRLLYRVDDHKERQHLSEEKDANTPYGRARNEFTAALRDAEMALNESRVDLAIANAHAIMVDPGANRRWLQDALSRLDTLRNKNLLQMVDTMPSPDLPPLNILQKVGFRLLGIEQMELARRSLASMRKVAELQTTQLIEMAKLIAESFESAGDQAGFQQAMSLLGRLSSGQ